jgi:hypothetical protein
VLISRTTTRCGVEERRVPRLPLRLGRRREQQPARGCLIEIAEARRFDRDWLQATSSRTSWSRSSSRISALSTAPSASFPLGRCSPVRLHRTHPAVQPELARPLPIRQRAPSKPPAATATDHQEPGPILARGPRTRRHHLIGGLRVRAPTEVVRNRVSMAAIRLLKPRPRFHYTLSVRRRHPKRGSELRLPRESGIPTSRVRARLLPARVILVTNFWRRPCWTMRSRLRSLSRDGPVRLQSRNLVRSPTFRFVIATTELDG